MPRKTKEANELKEEKKETKKTAKNAPTSKKTATKKTTSKATTKKKSTTTKPKTTTAKSKRTTAKSKTTTKKNSTTKKVEVVEYYDLPYRYNQTIVKVLAQTPTTLFIYWDISDSDRENYIKQYGDNFFETTKPILIVYNDTLGYSFEVEINDFANSWYLHVADSKCDYRIELGRRPISNNTMNTDYIYITTSNEIESPNDKILLDKNQKMVYFKNVKTGAQSSKDISSLSFIRNMGKIYNIYDLYKKIYEDENLEDIYNNPSSGNPSSSFK